MNPNIRAGLFFCVISGVCFSITSVLVREMSSISAAQLNCYSSLGVLVSSFPTVIISRRSILLPWRTFIVVFVRSSVVTFFLILKYVAFQYLPIGIASIIVYGDPVFVTIAGRLCLKEPCGIVQSVIIVFTVAGIVLTVNTPSMFNEAPGMVFSEQIIGTAAACVALIFGTVGWVLLRMLKDIHSSVTTFHLGWISSLESIAICAAMGGYRSIECGLQSWFGILIGKLNFLGHLCITLAVRRVFVGTAATLRCATVIFLNAIWQISVYKEIPDVYNVIGMVLVIVSVLSIGFSNCLATPSSDSSSSKKLKWISKMLNK